MAADDIIEDPSSHLMTQSELFQAEGGWNTVGLQMGLAIVGAGVACTLHP